MGTCASHQRKPKQKKTLNIEKRSSTLDSGYFVMAEQEQTTEEVPKKAVLGTVSLEEENGENTEEVEKQQHSEFLEILEQKDEEKNKETKKETITEQNNNIGEVPISFCETRVCETSVALAKENSAETNELKIKTNELKIKIAQLEKEVKLLTERHESSIQRTERHESFIQREIANQNRVISREDSDIFDSTSNHPAEIIDERGRSISEDEEKSVDSGETTENPQKVPFSICHSLSNSQLEDMCASSDFIKIFVDQIENVLIDSYKEHGLDFSVDFDFNVSFVSFHKKISMHELRRKKERIPDELINTFIDEIAEEYARSTSKNFEESREIITHKLAEVRHQIKEELHELMVALSQRLNSFCEKYVKVWKSGYALRRTSRVELDFGQFIASATLRYSANFNKIIKWASDRGKVLEGHEFIDLHQIRSRSVLVDV